jgi:AraC family transcriptional regulator
VSNPSTMDVDLDQIPDLTQCHTDDHFLVQHVEATGVRGAPIVKTSAVPALLVSVALAPLGPRTYRLWVDGKLVPPRQVPIYRANVLEFGAQPTLWSSGPYRYVHFNIRRRALDEVAEELDYERVGTVRPIVYGEDLVLAQMARSAMSIVKDGEASPLALDHFELVLAAHTIQQYAGVRRRTTRAGAALPSWKRARAAELLRNNLDGALRLADIARECDLSVSHFARAFKATFGVSPHRWLIEHRVELAKELLRLSDTSLAEIANQVGFADQAAFAKTFRGVVGMTPSQWRREQTVR